MLPDFDSMLFLRVSLLSLCANHIFPYTSHTTRFTRGTGLGRTFWGCFWNCPLHHEVTDTVRHKASLQFWLFVPGNPPVKHGNFGQQKTHGFRLEKRKNMRLMDSFDLHAGPCVWYVSCFTYLCHDLRVTLHGASGRRLPLLVCLVVWVKI